MNKKTAIDWFYNKLKQGKFTSKDTIDFLYETAKEMEQEQIIDAFEEGQKQVINLEGNWYYNETYNNEKA